MWDGSGCIYNHCFDATIGQGTVRSYVMDWADGIAETARVYSGTAFGMAEAAVLEREKRCKMILMRA